MRRWNRHEAWPSILAVAVGVLMATSLAAAVLPAQQDPEDAEASAEHPSQADEAVEPRGQGDVARSQREELKRVLRLQKLVRTQLKLDADQAARINEVFKGYLQRLREGPKEPQGDAADNKARTSELQRQLAAASRDKNTKEVRRLMRELRDLRGQRPGKPGEHGWLRARILKELDKKQAGKFRSLFTKVMTTRRKPGALMREVQVFHRALQSLELSPEQKDATSKHLAGLRQLQSQARAGYRDAVAAKVRQAILGELSETQGARFLEAEAEARKSLPDHPGAHGRKPPPDMPRRPLRTDTQPEATGGQANEPEKSGGKGTPGSAS